MINTERIVPVTSTDLLTLYSVSLAAAAAAASGTAPEKLDATNAGEFASTTNSKTYFCTEPVKSFNFGSSVTSETVYFVPARDYKGFTKTSNTLTVSGTVTADGSTLYKAALSTNALTITKVGL